MRSPVIYLVAAVFFNAPQSRAQEKITVEGGAPLPTKAMRLHGSSDAFDIPPKFISGAAPTQSKAQGGEAGSALIAMRIDELGWPTDFKILQSDSTFLVAHAITALKQWRFEPAKKNGKPVACFVRVPMFYGGFTRK